VSAGSMLTVQKRPTPVEPKTTPPASHATYTPFLSTSQATVLFLQPSSPSRLLNAQTQQQPPLPRPARGVAPRCRASIRQRRVACPEEGSSRESSREGGSVVARWLPWLTPLAPALACARVRLVARRCPRASRGGACPRGARAAHVSRGCSSGAPAALSSSAPWRAAPRTGRREAALPRQPRPAPATLSWGSTLPAARLGTLLVCWVDTSSPCVAACSPRRSRARAKRRVER
jgi:hypothetical protein